MDLLPRIIEGSIDGVRALLHRDYIGQTALWK